MADFKKENDSAQGPIVAAEVERDETIEEVPLYKKKARLYTDDGHYRCGCFRGALLVYRAF